MEQYETLLLDRKFAQERYGSALVTLESARVEASRKQRYLVAFVPPSLQDESLAPRRVWNTATVFLGAFLIHAIGSLIWAAVKEHIGL